MRYRGCEAYLSVGVRVAQIANFLLEVSRTFIKLRFKKVPPYGHVGR
jgi:hypothetical protein